MLTSLIGVLNTSRQLRLSSVYNQRIFTLASNSRNQFLFYREIAQVKMQPFGVVDLFWQNSKQYDCITF